MTLTAPTSDVLLASISTPGDSHDNFILLSSKDLVANQSSGSVIQMSTQDLGFGNVNIYLLRPITLIDPAQAYNDRLSGAQAMISSDLFANQETIVSDASSNDSSGKSTSFLPDTISIRPYSSVGGNGNEGAARLSPQELSEYRDSLSLLNALDDAGLAKWRQNIIDYNARHGLVSSDFSSGNIMSNENAGLLAGNNGSTLITNDGGTLIGDGGSTLITNDGGTLIGDGGSTVISPNGSNIISQGGGNVLGDTGGAGIIAAGGGNIIAAGGGNIIAAGGGNLVGNSGGTLISTAGGAFGFTGGNAIAQGGSN